MSRVDEMIEQLSTLSPLELVELTVELRERWGVSPLTPLGRTAPGPQNGAPTPAPADEEPTSFAVVLTDTGPNRLEVIKAVRAATGLGLMESKAFVDALPQTVRDNLSKDEAAALALGIINVGGKTSVIGAVPA